MTQKVCVITGATEGIGKATIFKLAEQKLHLIVIGRNQEKMNSLAQSIKLTYPETKIDCFVADLAQMEQVRAAAYDILERFDTIDVLINNAGAYYANRYESKEGFELTFALNHLSYFLLSHLLLPALKKSNSGRVVNVSSAAHRWVSLDMEDLQMKKIYSGLVAYGRSKLMNILFTYEFAKRLKDTNLTVNCLHPGFVASKFGHNNQGWIGKFFYLRQQLFGVNTDTGSETSVYLATSSEINNISGQYFKRCKPIKSSKLSYSAKLAVSLYEQSCELAF